MDSTLIMTTTGVVVVILQLLTIALIFNLKHKVNVLLQNKSQQNPHFDRDRKDQDFRRNRRPQDMQRPQQKPQINNNNQATPVTADPVEKSLRDINLRLKNAERDQDLARKKMQDTGFSRDNRDGRRDHDSRRGGGRDNGRKDFRRDNREKRGNWQDRRDHSQAPQNHASGQSVPVPQTPEVSPIDTAVKDQTVQVTENVVMQSTTPDIPVTDLGTSEENVQHGRKILVKRRMLDEEQMNSPDIESNEPASASGEVTQSEVNSDEAVTTNPEIKFGRR